VTQDVNTDHRQAQLDEYRMPHATEEARELSTRRRRRKASTWRPPQGLAQVVQDQEHLGRRGAARVS